MMFKPIVGRKRAPPVEKSPELVEPSVKKTAKRKTRAKSLGAPTPAAMTNVIATLDDEDN